MVKNKIITFIIVILLLSIIFKNTLHICAKDFDNEELIICNATVEDDYIEDTIIVVFKHNVSFEFKEYTIEDFNDINCIYVEEITLCIQLQL